MRTAPSRLTHPLICATLWATAVLAMGCESSQGGVERFVVPDGASLHEISDTLAAREIIGWPLFFRLYVRLRGDDDEMKAGTYELTRNSGWRKSADVLTAGRVVTIALTIPEGWKITQIAERIAPIAGVPAESVALRLLDPALADSLGAPGPTLEGYLFPETYRFAQRVSVETIAVALLQTYRDMWTDERRAALDSAGLDERALVALASIVQAEARWEDEMPLISAVFHNRLRRGMRLQADPTVQYALQAHQSRLLFSHIDSVADHPYNTYTHAGLPPGPIGSPGAAAIDAALHPAALPYLYFVARDDGRHEFSRTLQQHNRTVERIRRSRAQ